MVHQPLRKPPTNIEVILGSHIGGLSSANAFVAGYIAETGLSKVGATCSTKVIFNRCHLHLSSPLAHGQSPCAVVGEETASVQC